MEYNFREVEKKWQKYWAEHKTFRAENNSSKPKYYVLDMFPYPSGAGLHVGHPLGYIASDIFARYKRLQGFNVLHPMGYDSFGLPAEQYAIQTGQHPKITTENNIARYREQLDKIGFSFDWDREVRTSDPEYYKWTQWIFIKLFNSWYNPETNKAEDISTLIAKFKIQSSKFKIGTAEKVFEELNEKEKSDILLEYRLAYLSDTMVNWCPQLGTVLANEEVKDGVSERGGYPVERKLMKQWSLRITAYADRLLNDLEGIDWTESIKEAQRNWIGKSEGTSLKFKIESSHSEVEVFTTRPDTIFGVSFVTLAPEHELVAQITTPEQKKAVEEYVAFAKNRSERERMADVKKITGVFTGAYVVHPFTGKKVPVWIGDYVLAGYGTGAVMAVPAHDTRDYAFANHFGIEKKIVINPPSAWDFEKESYDEKEGKLVNSDFLDGLEVKAAIKKCIAVIEEKGMGKGKTNYRLRDAIFGRQRYWGEPIPVYYVNDIPKVLDESELPLILPEVDKYLPTETGEPPLARAASSWKKDGKFDYEYSTMPGWAGSSWYFLRYMDAHNSKEFASKEAINYWKNVDLYIGGAEHATGHLLYVRFWTKFLYDLGLIPVIEPAQKLINQGMIQGVSAFVYRIVPFFTWGVNIEGDTGKLPVIMVTKSIADQIENGELAEQNRQKLHKEAIEYFKKLNPSVEFLKFEDRIEIRKLHVDVNIVKNNVLDKEAFLKWREEYSDTLFVTEENGDYICGSEVEKMSKSKWNVVSPDDMVEQVGADALRLYEMFLGPLELSKPWNTNGISGVSNFIRKLWRLYHNGENFNVSEEPASKPELKALHKTIKKIAYDIEHFSFNTSVSNFMICVNELTDLKCNKREVLEPLAIIIAPYAPHVAEELWSRLGHKESITYATFPEFNESYLVESAFNYPVSINGKTKFFHEYDLSLTKEQLEKEILANEQTIKYLDGKAPKKVIVVHNKIVNIVV
ncbi:MAG: leucine--tRNA ligase [Bacteroidia bacterium]